MTRQVGSRRSVQVTQSRDLLVVTSGFGSRMGGIGQVTESMVCALERSFRVGTIIAAAWPSKLARGAWLWARLCAQSRSLPRVVVYEHKGLARVHPHVPRLRSVPYVVFLHGIEVWRPLSDAERRVLQGAALLLANSETTIAQCRRYNPWLPEARVVHLGVSVPPETSRINSPPVAVLVGRLDPAERYKGHDEILDAWPRVRAAVPNARFVAIGGGSDLPRLRARVRDEGLDGVELTGFVSRDEKHARLRGARLAFALSRGEGFGLASVEAAAGGLPLIGLAGTVIEELFPRGVGIKLLHDLRPESLAEATIELMSRPELAAELGRQGRTWVAQRYTRQQFEARLLAAMRRFAAGHQVPAPGPHLDGSV